MWVAPLKEWGGGALESPSPGSPGTILTGHATQHLPAHTLLSSPNPLQQTLLIYWSLQHHGGSDGGHPRVGAFNQQPGALVYTQTHCLMPFSPFPSSVTEAGELVVAR